MFLIIQIIPFIDPSIRPFENPLTMHLVVLPMPLVLFAVSPDYPPEPFHHIVLEIPFVSRPIRPCELSFPLLDSFAVHSSYVTSYPSYDDPSVHFSIPNPCWMS